MSFKLSIVIPVYNNYNFTKDCLKDLFKLNNQTTEIIIVDNGSKDKTVSLFDVINPNFKYIINSANEGFAKACNKGFAKAKGDFIMFLNNDIRVRNKFDSWTNDITDYLLTNPRCLVGPTVGVLDDNLNFVCEGNKFIGDHWYISGWNICSSRKGWEELILEGEEGPFSSEFGLAYFEDTDLSFRAKKLDFQFQIIDVPVIHFGRMTSSKLGLSNLYKSAQFKFKQKWLK